MVKTAFAGGERGQWAAPDVGGPLGRALESIPAGSPERRLLDAAALLVQYERTGAAALEQTHSDLPMASQPDPLPRCPEAAASCLDAMQDGPRREMLGEWLGLMAQNNWRVPEERLPRLLDAAQKWDQPALVARVIGERGRWLAALNPDWGYATGLPGQDAEMIRERWQLEPFQARRAMLFALRHSDPALAREILASTWDQEDGETREAFIPALGVNLSQADEDFLERALEDRRKAVRSFAAVQLSGLPGSRLRQRMRERVRAVIQTKRRSLGRMTVEIEPPSECDEAMQRDGVERKPPTGMGERAHWLQGLASLVFLQDWEEATALVPGKLVSLAAKTDWKGALLSGWTEAAICQDNPVWAEALWSPEGGQRDIRLFGHLPARVQRETLMRVVESSEEGQVWELAVAATLEWDVVFGEAFVQKLIDRSKTRGFAMWGYAPMANKLAAKLPPTAAMIFMLEQAEGEQRAAARNGPVLPGAMGDILAFRHEMRREFGINE